MSDSGDGPLDVSALPLVLLDRHHRFLDRQASFSDPLQATQCKIGHLELAVVADIQIQVLGPRPPNK